MVRIHHKLANRSTKLSGGEMQRVAIGRALVRKPSIYLMDEPLSSLDAKLRADLRLELKRIQAELGATMLYVTHDQIEAMTMADRIVVMHDGIVEQIGTPLELYDRPENLFVAQFIGSPAMNIVQGTLRRANGTAHVETPDGIRWPLGHGAGADGQAVSYGVRPDHLELAANQPHTVPAEVIVVEPTGSETELVVRIGDAQMIVETHGRPKLAPGDRVTFLVEPGNVHLFDQQTGQRLSA